MGHAYVEAFLRRPNSTVIATVRDPSSDATKSLSSLATGADSSLHVVKLDNA